jgi:NADH dehydrogenase FAD-containing subunit
MVIALDSEANLTGIPGLLEHAFPIATIGDGLFLRQQVLERLEEAGCVSDPEQRRALLTFAVVSGGLRGCATVAEIRALINSALTAYPTIDPREPRVLLFEEREALLSGFDPKTGSAARRRLERVGVEVLTGTKVAAVTPQEVVEPSGLRIPCRTVVGALVTRPRVVSTLPRARWDGRLAVDECLRAEGMEGITVAGDCAALREPTPPLIRRDIDMGRLAAYNVLASLRGYSLFRKSTKRPVVYVAALGRSVSLGYCMGLRFGGIPAWVVSRLSCLLTLPGLERNVRVLLDWILDIPFRSDIVVLAPQRTPKLTRAHYEAGDEIVRQGATGAYAYLLLAGEVEVLTRANGRSAQVATLKAGECFGEIAPLSNGLRTKTVKCLTPVDVVVIHRDHLLLLTEGYRELGGVLKAGISERMLTIFNKKEDDVRGETI